MNELLKELEEFIEQESDINESDESYKIKNEEEANEVLRRIKYFNSEIENVNKISDSEIERYTKLINDYREKKLLEFNNRMEHYQLLLEDYAKEQLKNKKAKTISLPFGKIGFKKQQDTFNYDEDTLLEYLRNNSSDFIKVTTKESIEKAKLKKAGVVENGHLYLDGKLVDGVTVTKNDDKFIIG